jgi:hypothetical protein
MFRPLKSAVAALFLAAAPVVTPTFVTPAQAGTIVGGSSMLGASELAQLETWLGQGPLTLTNIFTKGVDGNTSFDWHAAVDGQGATFSVLQIVMNISGTEQVTHTIGGYDPQSWASTGGYSVTAADADRTAFLFNLTTGVVQYQCKSTDPAICGVDNDPSNTSGQYQTYNQGSYGPTFGNGHDLYVNSALSGGYSYNYAYDVPGGIFGHAGQNGLDPNQSNWVFASVLALETFTIAAGPVEVPEPAPLALLAVGLLALGVARRKRAA